MDESKTGVVYFGQNTEAVYSVQWSKNDFSQFFLFFIKLMKKGTKWGKKGLKMLPLVMRALKMSKFLMFFDSMPCFTSTRG